MAVLDIDLAGIFQKREQLPDFCNRSLATVSRDYPWAGLHYPGFQLLKGFFPGGCILPSLFLVWKQLWVRVAGIPGGRRAGTNRTAHVTPTSGVNKLWGLLQRWPRKIPRPRMLMALI
jgi:hypothetical protein